jgi:hypothetical protein
MTTTAGRIRLTTASLAGRATVALLAATAAVSRPSPSCCNEPLPPCDPAGPASNCYRPPAPPPTCEPRHRDQCTKSPRYVGSGAYLDEKRDRRHVVAPAIVSEPGFIHASYRNP